jgi:hypothetical protein
MIFVVRLALGGEPPASSADLRILRMRATPGLVAGAPGEHDVFCVADAPEVLEADGWSVVPLHDGWYADDAGGGIAVWGNGRYWEVRATPFDVIARD